MRFNFRSLGGVSVFTISVSSLLMWGNAQAAERIVIKYSVFRQSLSVEELSTFAETGELSSSLRVNFALGRQNPALVRQYLTIPVKVNPVLLDRILNNPAGNVLLDEISQAIHTPSGRADRQALRAALVLSATGDRQISLIEVLENYPTSEVEVEGDRLEESFRLLSRLEGFIQDLLENLIKLFA